MTPEDLYSAAELESAKTSPTPHLEIYDRAPEPSSPALLEWDEALELMRWADDGGANLG